MKTILIVDDEEQLVLNIAGYLELNAGEFEIAKAFSGEEALEMVQRRPVDVLLTDIRLPGIDGIEVVRRALEVRPKLKVVVMTAFSSADLRNQAIAEGAIRFVEKPLDLEEMRMLLLSVSESRQGWTGQMGGLDLFDLAQLVALSGKSTVVRVTFGKERGILVFKEGTLVHASTRKLEGDQAFFAITGWDGGLFEEIAGKGAKKYQPNIEISTTHLLIEAARLRDEARGGVPSLCTETSCDEAGIITSNQVLAPPVKEERADHFLRREKTHMAIKDHLNELQDIAGFQAAAVFSPQGDMLEGFTNTSLDIKTVGMFANNALLNAQKATDQMGVGRGNMMQIRAPQAVVLMRCLNEATDFSATATGKAHFHTVVIMSPEGNVGMAAMILDKIVGKVAEEVR